MSDRISIAQLRADCLDPRFDPAEPIVVNHDELVGLVEAAEAAHRWQHVCRMLLTQGVAQSGYAMKVLGEIAGSQALDRFDFGD